jgi:hypothetical protein
MKVKESTEGDPQNQRKSSQLRGIGPQKILERREVLITNVSIA